MSCRPTAANDSLQLSQLLLQDRATGAAAQYGALVFNDSVIRHIPDAFSSLNMSVASLGTGELLNMLPLLFSALPSRLPGAGSGQLVGGLLPQLSTPESRVASHLIRRFQDNPGIVIVQPLPCEVPAFLLHPCILHKLGCVELLSHP